MSRGGARARGSSERSTTAPASRGDLPVLALPYGEDGPDPMGLAEAARGLCRLAFVVDGTLPGVQALRRLLQRLGAVVDVAGRSPDETAAAVAAASARALLAVSDDALPLVAEVAGRLGLVAATPAQAEMLADKLAQRRALAAHGLDVPRCWVLRLDDPDARKAVQDEARFPVVVKPRRGSGSRDAFVAADPGELADRFAAALRARAGDGVRAAGELVVEEYLAGASDPGTAFADYLSAEVASDGTEVASLALTGRTPLAPPLRETGLVLPSDLSGEGAGAVAAEAVEAVRALGAPPGCFHVEIKLTPAGPRVIEVNGRVGGTVPDLLSLATGGFSLYRAAMRLALGEPLAAAVDGHPLPLPTRCVAFRRLVQAPMGATGVEEVGGLDDALQVPGITEVIAHLPAGSPLDWRRGTNAYVVRVTGTAADHAAAGDRLAQVDRALRVRYAGLAATPGDPAGAPGAN